MRLLVPLVVLLAGALVFTTGACGTGASDFSPQIFTGTYFYVSFAGDDNQVPAVGTSLWGTLTSDDQGTVGSGTVSRNDNSVINGPGPLSPFTHLTGPNGRTIWRIANVDSYEGGVGLDGRAAVLATRITSLSPQVFLLTKQQGAFNNASLSGIYHLAAFFYNSTSTMDGSIWGTVDFDGVNMATLNVTTNTGGVVAAQAPSVTAYNVDPNGRLTYTLSTAPLEGGVLEGGEMAILGGQTTNGGIQILVVLIKAGAGLGEGTFTGSYNAIGLFASNAGPPAWRSVTTLATADGAGIFNILAGRQNEDGVLSANVPVAGPYTVAPNGALTLTPGQALMGAVSTSGQYVAAAGGTAANDNLEMWIFVR